MSVTDDRSAASTARWSVGGVFLEALAEAGVDGFCPMERAAGMDPVRTRREYGLLSENPKRFRQI